MAPCSEGQTGNSAADIVALGLRSLVHCGLASVIMRVGDSNVFPMAQTDNTDVDILLTGSEYPSNDARTSTSTSTSINTSSTVAVLEAARACLVGAFGEADTSQRSHAVPRACYTPPIGGGVP